MPTWLITFGKFLVSNPIARAAVLIVAAFGVHKALVWRETQKAVAEERKEAKIEGQKKKADIESDISEERDELRKKQEERREDEDRSNPRDRFERPDRW